MLMGLGITMMPTIMLSGFVFPRMSLPPFLHVLSCVVPATWYLQIVRGIILKGATIKELWLPALVLAGQAVALLGLASRRFGREH
jgi:ABC-2 type transport system permease protein